MRKTGTNLQSIVNRHKLKMTVKNVVKGAPHVAKDLMKRPIQKAN